jgi:MFS family permease
MASQSVGNWLGGVMPGWVASARGFDPMSPQAYGGALLIIAGVEAVALIPLLLMRMPKLGKSQRSVFAPISYAQQHPRLLSKLIAPILITSIGAGLIMPFMNVFFRSVHGASDATIGSLFALGSLSMAVGFLVAPPLSDRYGKIEFVVATQALSIPFMLVLGFSPSSWVAATAYLVRLGLMNMSNPVYQTFVMERVDRQARATVASLTSMAWNFGWAFSPSVSAWMQVEHGFEMVFAVASVLYAVAILMYRRYFLVGRGGGPAEESAPASP